MTPRGPGGGRPPAPGRRRPSTGRGPGGPNGPRTDRAAGSRDGGLGGEQVEGRHAVRALLETGRRRVLEVWVTGAAAASEELAALAQAAGAPLHTVDAERLAATARTEAPQGVLAFADPVPEASLDDLLAAPDAFLVVLEGVTDPQNLGAVLRTADAAGVTGVVLPRHRAARLSPAAVKAAAGAVEHLAIAAVAGVPTFLERASRAGLWSVGLDAGGGTDLFALPVADRPLVIVLGAEGQGLGRLTRLRCDVLAGIPMQGHVESLNVSAAAAVALFEVARRRRS